MKSPCSGPFRKEVASGRGFPYFERRRCGPMAARPVPGGGGSDEGRTRRCDLLGGRTGHHWPAVAAVQFRAAGSVSSRWRNMSWPALSLWSVSDSSAAICPTANVVAADPRVDAAVRGRHGVVEHDSRREPAADSGRAVRWAWRWRLRNIYLVNRQRELVGDYSRRLSARAERSDRAEYGRRTTWRLLFAILVVGLGLVFLLSARCWDRRRCSGGR